MAGSFRHKTSLLPLAGLLLIGGLLVSAGEPAMRRFFLEPTLELPVDTVHHYLVRQEDSIPNDTLFQLRSAEGFPLAYYRKINTNVCFDGKCRMLKVRLYWNITGRYLGIELPPGEFLSKSDHEQFNLSEYARMNRLLADPLSPLADYSFEALVPDAGLPNESVPAAEVRSPAVDAITAATSPAMADYVVEGAAYTTYRLWHFTYGPTRDEVIRLTKASLSPQLLRKILESPDMSDVAWAFQQIENQPEMGPGLAEAVTGFIKNDDYSLAAMAISAIHPADLSAFSLQQSLLQKMQGLNYSLKNAIVAKLAEAPELDDRIKPGLTQELRSADGSLLSNILELFLAQGLTDDETCETLSEMLEHENPFAAGKIYEFLAKAESGSETVLKRMARYRLQQGN